jgi:hypothetical protein
MVTPYIQSVELLLSGWIFCALKVHRKSELILPLLLREQNEKRPLRGVFHFGGWGSIT